MKLAGTIALVSAFGLITTGAAIAVLMAAAGTFYERNELEDDDE